jgi:hypothetical protein
MWCFTSTQGVIPRHRENITLLNLMPTEWCSAKPVWFQIPLILRTSGQWTKGRSASDPCAVPRASRFTVVPPGTHHVERQAAVTLRPADGDVIKETEATTTARPEGEWAKSHVHTYRPGVSPRHTPLHWSRNSNPSSRDSVIAGRGGGVQLLKKWANHECSDRNITPSLDDRYKYTRVREGKTAKR